ncbi:MAG: ATP-binding cassette domain-containing protein, partial [Clostridia bacterium]|nr:ATP-binding cassette domain-containing protein [Clostridia bacterium]
MNEIVSLNNVNLIYQSIKHETTALSDINLTIQEQEFISIVGPSGCGKTTILSLISGLIKPTTGEVKEINKTPSPKYYISGYMFQRDNLLPWRNIEKNIYFGLEL